MKLIVSANSINHLNSLIKKNVDGVIISIDKLAVNDSFYITTNELKKIDFKDKEVFVSLNKLMHNSDLELLRKTIEELKEMNVRIIFYDMAVYNIAKEYDMVNRLIISQDHLNASVLSNKFYLKRGIKASYITSDITKDELLEIKEKSGMEVFFLGYGYAPIFYSRRYLIRNYLIRLFLPFLPPSFQSMGSLPSPSQVWEASCENSSAWFLPLFSLNAVNK